MPLRLLCASLLLLLGACASTGHRPPSSHQPPRHQPPPAPGQKAPQPQGGVKIGKPYVVMGKTYVPADDRGYDQQGIASWYGPTCHTKPTANGEIYNQDDVTAAHKTLPMPSWVEVQNLDNGRKLVVRINDRGPFVDGRIIDLSRRSAQLLGVDGPGLARVRVKRVFPEGDWARNAPRLASSTLPPVVAAAEGITRPPSPPAPSVADPSVQVVQAPLVPATAAPPATVSGRYIQVVAVSDEGRAKALASVLADFGPAQALPTGTGLWRVRIGPVAADTAENVLFEVRAGGWPDARIVTP